MFEEYNNEIKKILRLLLINLVVYFSLINIEGIQIEKQAIPKFLMVITIIYIILENYCPVIVVD